MAANRKPTTIHSPPKHGRPKRVRSSQTCHEYSHEQSKAFGGPWVFLLARANCILHIAVYPSMPNLNNSYCRCQANATVRPLSDSMPNFCICPNGKTTQLSCVKGRHLHSRHKHRSHHSFSDLEYHLLVVHHTEKLLVRIKKRMKH